MIDLKRLAMLRHSDKYLKAVENDKPGKAAFHLQRMQHDAKCCHPYPPAKHTATCPTVVHMPMPLAPEGSGLTACGIVGPIGAPLPVGPFPNCERCVPAHLRLPESR